MVLRVSEHLPGPSGGDFDAGGEDFDADDMEDEVDADASVISGDENADTETDENA